MNILLVGKAPAVTFLSGSSLEHAVGVLESAHIDQVILGGGRSSGPYLAG